MKPEALKLLQEVTCALDSIMDGYCGSLDDARDCAAKALKDIKAAIFMETPAPSMKFNLYDFTSDDPNRPILACVHHEEGYKVATDATLLVAVKDAYPEELEGKNIDKMGEEDKGGPFPKWKLVFPNHNEKAEDYHIDFDKITVWMKELAAEKKMKGKRGARPHFVKVGPAFFKLELLARFAKFMRAKGIDTLRVEDSRRAAACFAEDGSKGLIMPCISTSFGFRDKYLAEAYETKDESIVIYEAA